MEKTDTVFTLFLLIFPHHGEREYFGASSYGRCETPQSISFNIWLDTPAKGNYVKSSVRKNYNQGLGIFPAHQGESLRVELNVTIERGSSKEFKPYLFVTK